MLGCIFEVFFQAEKVAFFPSILGRSQERSKDSQLKSAVAVEGFPQMPSLLTGDLKSLHSGTGKKRAKLARVRFDFIAHGYKSPSPISTCVEFAASLTCHKISHLLDGESKRSQHDRPISLPQEIC